MGFRHGVGWCRCSKDTDRTSYSSSRLLRHAGSKRGSLPMCLKTFKKNKIWILKIDRGSLGNFVAKPENKITGPTHASLGLYRKGPTTYEKTSPRWPHLTGQRDRTDGWETVDEQGTVVISRRLHSPLVLKSRNLRPPWKAYLHESPLSSQFSLNQLRCIDKFHRRGCTRHGSWSKLHLLLDLPRVCLLPLSIGESIPTVFHSTVYFSVFFIFQLLMAAETVGERVRCACSLPNSRELRQFRFLFCNCGDRGGWRFFCLFLGARN